MKIQNKVAAVGWLFGCWFNDVLNSNRLIQFLPILKVKIILEINNKVIEFFLSLSKHVYYTVISEI
jgi:hypothetical protein